MKRLAYFAVLCALLAGCNKIRKSIAPSPRYTLPAHKGGWPYPERTSTEKTNAAPAAKRTVEKDLEDLGIYLMAQVQRTGRPAGSLADATVLAEQGPVLYAQVKAGVYVVRWGIEPKAFGAAVIAYEAQTPTKGGYVLLGGATVAKATPEEFKSALNNRD